MHANQLSQLADTLDFLDKNYKTEISSGSYLGPGVWLPDDIEVTSDDIDKPVRLGIIKNIGNGWEFFPYGEAV